MRPTEILEDEHTLIERVLDAQEGICLAIERGESVAFGTLEKLVDFFEEFADGCHHRKEEELLFPALKCRGLAPDGGPAAVILEEHSRGRACVAEMAEALEQAAGGEARAQRAFVDAARTYSRLLRSHIQKENGVLFRMAERLLDEATKNGLEESFEALDDELGPATREHYTKLAEELEQLGCSGCCPGGPPPEKT